MEIYSGKRLDRLESHANFRLNLAGNVQKETRYTTEAWQSYDSPLLDQENRIPIAYDEFFRVTLPAGVNLKEYLFDVFSDKARSVIGIEFGGPGSRLFSGFPKGFFERTLGVTLFDHRDKSEKDFDVSRNHALLATDQKTYAQSCEFPIPQQPLTGDLTNSNTQEEVKTWLNGRKADLIIERIMGPLLYVPKDPYYIAKYISEWYKLLSNNGVMFIEIPPFMEGLLWPWITYVKNVAGDSLEIQGVDGNYDFNARLRLKKNENAPEEIPLLIPRQVRKAYKASVKHKSRLKNLLNKIGLFS